MRVCNRQRESEAKTFTANTTVGMQTTTSKKCLVYTALSIKVVCVWLRIAATTLARPGRSSHLKILDWQCLVPWSTADLCGRQAPPRASSGCVSRRSRFMASCSASRKAHSATCGQHSRAATRPNGYAGHFRPRLRGTLLCGAGAGLSAPSYTHTPRTYSPSSGRQCSTKVRALDTLNVPGATVPAADVSV